MSPEVLSTPLQNHAALPISRRGRSRRPVVLLVTPELSTSRFLERNGKQSPCVKAGGLADVSALLLDLLADEGVDAHVAIPRYSKLIRIAPGARSRNLHLCEDGEFEHRNSVYDCDGGCNLRAALAFQRAVIRHVLPRVRPDVVHCHDWMTGLIPAAAGAMGISSLFTIHNLHDEETTLAHIENAGIDARAIWRRLYFKGYPWSYESSRDGNPVSLLASGILSADETNTVSPGFLQELRDGVHGSREVGGAIRAKAAEGRAHGILNSLPADLLPQNDPFLVARYDAATHREGKRANKAALQIALGLARNPDAPLVFWPSRLEPHQKGCGLLAEILRQILADFPDLQFVFIADGPGRENLGGIVADSGLEHRVALRDFSERESRMGYAASDFTLMPSSFEPCGLAQMIGPRYGSVPVVRSTGGLRDTVIPLDRGGNGILFESHDARGLRRALEDAMRFHALPAGEKEVRIAAVMRKSAADYQPVEMMERYLELYDRLLQRR